MEEQLDVEVDGSRITVTMPETRFWVTYQKKLGNQRLVLIGSWHEPNMTTPEGVAFRHGQCRPQTTRRESSAGLCEGPLVHRLPMRALSSGLAPGSSLGNLTRIVGKRFLGPLQARASASVGALYLDPLWRSSCSARRSSSFSLTQCCLPSAAQRLQVKQPTRRSPRLSISMSCWPH